MSKPQQGYGRDVKEADAGSSWRWPDTPPDSARPDARPVAPFNDTDLATALSAPNVARWMSVTPADPADPRSISMHVRDGLVDAGPRGLHGARLHDIASVGGTVPHAHARNRIPVRGTDHPTFAVAKGTPTALHREATSYAVHAALARVPGPTTGHFGSQRPADRPMRAGTGSGEIDLQLAQNSGVDSGIGAGATGPVMETATGAVVGRPFRPGSPALTHRAAYTAPTALAGAVTNSAPVREVSGAVVGRVSPPHWRQYHTARISAGYTAPVMPQPYTRGIAIAAREADSNLRLTAIACAGVPPISTASAGSPATSTGAGATQGTAHDGPPALARIQEQLAAWQPRYLVSVLASEADLTLLEGALALKTGVSIVMPLSAFDTRQALVTSAPNVALGASIGRRYDRLLDTVRADGGGIYGSTGADAVGMRLLSEALSLARQHALVGQVPSSLTRCLIVTAGAIDDGDMSPDEGYGLARLARLHDVPATFISADGGAR